MSQILLPTTLNNEDLVPTHVIANTAEDFLKYAEEGYICRDEEKHKSVLAQIKAGNTKTTYVDPNPPSTDTEDPALTARVDDIQFRLTRTEGIVEENTASIQVLQEGSQGGDVIKTMNDTINQLTERITELENAMTEPTPKPPKKESLRR